MALGSDYVDIEYSAGIETIRKLLSLREKSKVIASHHDFNGMPSDLSEIYSRLKNLGADVIKIACTAQSLADNLSMLRLIETAKSENIALIGLCMGEKGAISRILGPAFGGYCTFGSSAKGKETAPGQIPVEYLKRVYRSHSLKKEGLKIYGLAGNPVSSSKGYLLHNLLFKEYGMNAVYLNFPTENFNEFIGQFRNFIDGLSITMPYKEEALRYCDTLSPEAEKIRAVNTLVRNGDKLAGHNTDFLGAKQALLEKTRLAGKKVLLLGAGGVARAIAYAVLSEKANLTITNRTFSKASTLAAELSCSAVQMKEINWRTYDILINATSVGMRPREVPVPMSKIRNMIVFDAIYNPLITELLHQAEKNSCTIISGMRMFLYQAAAQFFLWTGKKPDSELMEDIILQYVVNE